MKDEVKDEGSSSEKKIHFLSCDSYILYTLPTYLGGPSAELARKAFWPCDIFLLVEFRRVFYPLQKHHTTCNLYDEHCVSFYSS